MYCDDDAPLPPTLESVFQQTLPKPPPLSSNLLAEQAQKRQRSRAIMLQNTERHEEMHMLSTDSADVNREEALQSVWMRTMVDEFGEELDALRKVGLLPLLRPSIIPLHPTDTSCLLPLQKEPTLGADGGSRVPLLIDALQAGSELFSRGPSSSDTAKMPVLHQIDEVSFIVGPRQDKGQ